jgi:hypothetical protein
VRSLVATLERADSIDRWTERRHESVDIIEVGAPAHCERF